MTCVCVSRSRVPDSGVPDGVRVRAVHLHAGSDHGGALVHHNLRHPPEPSPAPQLRRQAHGHGLALLPRHGRPATGRRQQLRQDKVSDS